MFPGLTEGAANLDFGGSVEGPRNKASPPMGFGTFPARQYKTSAYFADMQISDENNTWLGLYADWHDYVDCPKYYGVQNFGENKHNGFNIEYGGPGGNCGAKP